MQDVFKRRQLGNTYGPYERMMLIEPTVPAPATNPDHPPTVPAPATYPGVPPTIPAPATVPAPAAYPGVPPMVPAPAIYPGVSPIKKLVLCEYPEGSVPRLTDNRYYVCTNSAFKQGQLIAEYVEEYIDAYEIRSIHLMRVPKVEFQTHNGVRRFTSLCIDEMVQGNISRFCKHSCDPNTGVDPIDVEYQRHLILFALKDITPAPNGLLEITISYPKLIKARHEGCYCGASNCIFCPEPATGHQPARL
jgi:hypothetical protein